MEAGRRDFFKTGALAVGGFAVGSAFTAPACGTKNLSGWVLSITTAFGEIKPLLVELGLGQAAVDRIGGFIDTAVKIAKDFDEAYKAGKFTDARTLFLNLGSVVTQVASELGATNNRLVKLALVSISIARIAIAALLQGQAEAQPAVMAEVSKAKAKGGDDARAIREIERLSAVDIDKVLAAIQ